MRIQHNIMAMNAYRNYNTNTKALSGNLEKLSSGYKINRAGDDAAGLAISEKMRAQITGLDAAQKNVKDGISLVKTAEGAMQEIQDMLNRMDYLATQSANGTYDNEVDRDNLNKEMEALKSEINRIADSANFNGIKLLNGERDGAVKTETVKAETTALTIANEDTSKQPNEAMAAGNTVVKKGSTDVAKTEFVVDLRTLAITDATAGDKLTLTIGAGGDGTDATNPGAKIELTLAAGTLSYTTGELATALKTQFEAGNKKIGNQEFEVAVDTTAGTLTFTQKEDPNSASEVVPGAMKVEVAYTPNGATAPTPFAATGGGTVGTLGNAVTAGTAGTDSATIDFSNLDADELAQLAEDAGVADGTSITMEWNTDHFELKAGAEVLASTATTGVAVDDTTLTFYTDPADTGTALTGTVDVTAVDAIAATTYVGGVDTGATFTAGTTPPAAAGAAAAISGQYESKTNTITQGAAEDAGQLASTEITMTEDLFADGNTITLGDLTFTVEREEGAAASFTGTKLTVDSSLTGDALYKAVGAALSNQTTSEAFTIGYDDAKANKLGIYEKAGQTVYTTELMTKDEMAKLFSVTTAETTKETEGKGTALRLQIGDTSDSFNQLGVNIGDMHVEAMGSGAYKDEKGNDAYTDKTIRSIDIANQENAAEAIQVIRNAINYVSGVRGDLGAIQNRLEHTGNNLSVMAENIQDAESTIRDTDVANEMMSYVKNNILVQSAQAMLAQANQVPQGVLQLLG